MYGQRQNPCMSLGGLVLFSLAFGGGFWINMWLALAQGSGAPLVAMFLLILAPFPLIVFCQHPNSDMPDHLQDDDDVSRGSGRDVGILFFGMMMTVAFGSLFVAVRQYKLTPNGFLLALFGACVTGVVSFMMAKCSMKGNRL